MNYVKKMCILRQIKQGFSADGKHLSGLIKAEQYGKNLAVEISIINLAPLLSGEYYCLLSDGKGKTEMLCLRGKSLFNILTDMDISGGFCGIICHVKTEVVPIAYGVNGNRQYDWKKILNATLPPVFPKKTPKNEPDEETAETKAETHDHSHILEERESGATKNPLSEEREYDDESIVEKNYFEEENNERKQFEKTIQNVRGEGANQIENAQEGANTSKNVDASRVLHPFKTNPDGYYLTVKSEIEELFKFYPKDKTLCGAFSCSDWVRVKGTAKDPQYLVGVLYEDGRARYICYALATENKDQPPEEIKNVCTFVPLSVFDTTRGFFVIFQSAASGECVKPEIV